MLPTDPEPLLPDPVPPGACPPGQDAPSPEPEAVQPFKGRIPKRTGKYSYRPGSAQYVFDDRRKSEYLKILARWGERAMARHAISISNTTLSAHRCKDPVFREAEEEAMAAYRMSLVKEIHRRGVEGWEEPIIGGRFRDEVVCKVRKYSDRLLILQAQKHDPDYRDHVTVDANTRLSGAVDVGLGALEHLAPESRADLRRILERETAKQKEGQDDGAEKKPAADEGDSAGPAEGEAALP